jgi:hypothetical protein
MKDDVYSSHVARGQKIDPWSELGCRKHLDVEVTGFILADFPLTDLEREKLVTDELGLTSLAGLFLEGLDSADTAELAVESWRK